MCTLMNVRAKRIELETMTDFELELELALVQAEADRRIAEMKKKVFDIEALKV